MQVIFFAVGRKATPILIEIILTPTHENVKENIENMRFASCIGVSGFKSKN